MVKIRLRWSKNQFWNWFYKSMLIWSMLVLLYLFISPTGIYARTNIIDIFYLVPKTLLFVNSDAEKEAVALTLEMGDDFQKAEAIQEWIYNNTNKITSVTYDPKKNFVDLWPLMDNDNCSEKISSSRRCIVYDSQGNKLLDCSRKPSEQKYNSWMFGTRCGSCEEVNSLFAFMLESTGVPTRTVKHLGANHVTAEFFYNGSWLPVDVWWSHNSSDNTLRYVGFDKLDLDKTGSFRYSMEAKYANETTEDVTTDYVLNHGFLNVTCEENKMLNLISPINRTIVEQKCSPENGLNMPLGAGRNTINYTINIDEKNNITITIKANETLVLEL